MCICIPHGPKRPLDGRRYFCRPKLHSSGCTPDSLQQNDTPGQGPISSGNVTLGSYQRRCSTGRRRRQAEGIGASSTVGVCPTDKIYKHREISGGSDRLTNIREKGVELVVYRCKKHKLFGNLGTSCDFFLSLSLGSFEIILHIAAFCSRPSTRSVHLFSR